MPTLSQTTLHAVIAAIIRASGAPADIVAQVADVLVDNNLVGHDSHGILRVPEYMKSVRAGEIVPSARPEILKETATSALISGNWSFGQAAAAFAIDVATAKAKKESVAVVSVVQAGHTGRLAAFTERAARQNVAIFMAIGTVDGPMTAPYGGGAALFGTNPIAFSIPNPSGVPVTLDMSTSAIAAGKIKVAKAQKKQLPPDSILNRNGQPSTDPEDFFNGGFLLPFGGHKGYALAVIAELLSGPMAGADAFSGVTARSGIFIFAVNAEVFRPLSRFQTAINATLSRIKAVPPRTGFDEVLVPGEPEARTRKEREVAGVPIAEETWRAVCASANDFGVDVARMVQCSA